MRYTFLKHTRTTLTYSAIIINTLFLASAIVLFFTGSLNMFATPADTHQARLGYGVAALCFASLEVALLYAVYTFKKTTGK